MRDPTRSVHTLGTARNGGSKANRRWEHLIVCGHALDCAEPERVGIALRREVQCDTMSILVCNTRHADSDVGTSEERWCPMSCGRYCCHHEIDAVRRHQTEAAIARH
eukprot:3939441-Rhodomonas_salina.1